MNPKRITRSERYEMARDAGMSINDAAYSAGISYSFATQVEELRNREHGRRAKVEPVNNDDGLVAALIAAGGYSRLSERELREGHAVCLPLIPFGAGA